MALKRILVPLDPSPYTESASQTACRIAQTHGAELTGIAVLDSPEIRSSIVPAIGPYYPMMLEEVGQKVAHADLVLSKSMEKFAALCSEVGVEHHESEYEGIPAIKLLESSIFYDLIVMGLETAFHFETRSGAGDTLDKLLDRTATPVLAVSPRGLEAPQQVVVAFDGSFSASRSLRDFMILAAPYAPAITLLSAGLEEEESTFLLANAKKLLSAHGFDQVDTVASSHSVDEAIEGDLIEKADLIVAGIRSRKPIRDFFVGSFTMGLIERGDTALFLSH